MVKIIVILLFFVNIVTAQVPIYNTSKQPAVTGSNVPVRTPLPTDLSGLMLWVKTDAGVLSATTSTGALTSRVRQWTDYSGNDNHLVNNTEGTTQPALIGDATQYPALYLTNNTVLTLTSTIPTSANMTVIMVYKIGAGGTTRTCPVLYGTNFLLAGFYSRTTYWDIGLYFSSSYTPDTYYNLNGTGLNNYEIVSFINRNNSTTAYAYTTVGVSGSVTQTGSYGNITGLWNNSNNATVYIKEIIIYDRAIPLTDNMNLVQYYLNNKYRYH